MVVERCSPGQPFGCLSLLSWPLLLQSIGVAFFSVCYYGVTRYAFPTSLLLKLPGFGAALQVGQSGPPSKTMVGVGRRAVICNRPEVACGSEMMDWMARQKNARA